MWVFENREAPEDMQIIKFPSKSLQPCYCQKLKTRPSWVYWGFYFLNCSLDNFLWIHSSFKNGFVQFRANWSSSFCTNPIYKYDYKPPCFIPLIIIINLQYVNQIFIYHFICWAPRVKPDSEDISRTGIYLINNVKD